MKRTEYVRVHMAGIFGGELEEHRNFIDQELSGNKFALSGVKHQYICTFPCGILQIYFVTLP